MLEAILVGIIDAFLLRKTMHFCSGVDTSLNDLSKLPDFRPESALHNS